MELSLNSDGFLVQPNDWDQATGLTLAQLNQLELTEAHWEIIFFIRAYYENFKDLPNARVFTKAIAKKLGTDKGNSRYLHRLFPKGPLKYACKIAGLPKPPTCL
ncbi:MAG: TusE/DsrC/DsvC family sulfur relay protein [Methylococcales bacterium]|nr:TusE/DsrC/DsvC family sulfur relay protein [Methylococcales bacterium]